MIRAIAGYAGQPVALRRSGKPTTGNPFTENRRFTIAPPGRIPLKSTLFSLVDVPDLHTLAELWPGTDEIWMGAGPVPEVLHRALIGLAWLVRWHLLPSLSPLAPLMFFATNRLRWGEHRGGMFVVVGGTHTNGQTVKRSWHLPSWLAPRSNSYETEQDGRFRFHVQISHPWTGLIVRYRGWLVAAA